MEGRHHGLDGWPRRSALAVTLGMLFCPFLCEPQASLAAEPIEVRVAEPAVGELFEIKLKKAEDRLEVHGDSEFVTFAVASKSGIGEAKIRRIGSEWPKRIMLRLNLRGLEQLLIMNVDAKVTLGVSVQSHGDHRQSLQLTKGDTESPVETRSPYFTKIQAFGRNEDRTNGIPLKPGFQLEIPRAMFQDNPRQLTVRWVDFFRS